MKPLLAAIIFIINALTPIRADDHNPWTDRAIATLNHCNTQLSQATNPLNPQAIITADQKFAVILQQCRSPRLLSTLETTQRHFFEKQLNILAESHVRQLGFALTLMEHKALHESEALDRLDTRTRHEETLEALQCLEDAVRGWR